MRVKFEIIGSLGEIIWVQDEEYLYCGIVKGYQHAHCIAIGNTIRGLSEANI